MGWGGGGNSSSQLTEQVFTDNRQISGDGVIDMTAAEVGEGATVNITDGGALARVLEFGGNVAEGAGIMAGAVGNAAADIVDNSLITLENSVEDALGAVDTSTLANERIAMGAMSNMLSAAKNANLAVENTATKATGDMAETAGNALIMAENLGEDMSVLALGAIDSAFLTTDLVSKSIAGIAGDVSSNAIKAVSESTRASSDLAVEEIFKYAAISVAVIGGVMAWRMGK